MKINKFQTILSGQTVFENEPETFEEAVIGLVDWGHSHRAAISQAARQFPAQHLVWKVKQARTPQPNPMDGHASRRPATAGEQAALLEFEMAQSRRRLSEHQRRQVNDEIDRLMKRATNAKRKDPEERQYTISGLIGILENELELKGAKKQMRTLQREFKGLLRPIPESHLLARLDQILNNGRGGTWHARQLRDHIRHRGATTAAHGLEHSPRGESQGERHHAPPGPRRRV